MCWHKYSDYEDKAKIAFYTCSALKNWDTKEDRYRDWEICKCEAWPHLVNCFVEKHFDNVWLARADNIQRYGIPRTADKLEVNYLMSTYGMLKRFIWDYELFVQANMARLTPRISDLDPASSRRREDQLDELVNWPTLNEKETFRLQRGFLRYELCCRINIIPDRDALIIKTTVDPIERNFHTLSHYLCGWEEEEVDCVWTYVNKQYRILARDLAVDFRYNVRCLSKKTREMPDSDVIAAPAMFSGLENDYLSDWAYDMSSYGLPLLQQLLRSGSDDQWRFLKNTTCKRSGYPEFFDLLQGAYPERMLGDRLQEWSRPITPPDDQGVSLLYKPMTNHLAKKGWDESESGKGGLKERGWIFWEDPSRLMSFAMLERVATGGFRVVGCHSLPVPHAGFEAEMRVIEEDREQTMYVTKEDHEALSAKYEAKKLTPEEDKFFLDRLRVISDQPTKQTLLVFQEVCSGMPPVEALSHRKL